MQGASFMVDTLENIMDMLMHCSHYVEPFFCSGGGGFIVVINVYGAWIKGMQTSVGGEFMGSGGCRIIGEFCKR